MNVLLDTNVLVWWLLQSERLSPNALRTILESDRAFVSAVSIWEVEIKRSRGNLDAPGNLEHILAERGVRPLPVTFAHATAAGRLPPIHRDPFDRMLVAQAIAESLTLLTAGIRFWPVTAA